MKQSNNHLARRHKIHFNAFDVSVFIILSLYSIGLLLLIAWALFSSFKTADSYLRNPTVFLGKNAFTFDNYLYVFTKMRVRVSRGGSPITFISSRCSSILYFMPGAVRLSKLR